MKRFFIIIFICVIPIVAILVAAFLTINTPITIIDSGSTNSPSFGLTVNPDGSGYDTSGANSDLTYFESRTFDYTALVDSIRDANTLKELFITKPSCAHSASFGTTRTLVYNWLTSGDASCVSSQNFIQALNAVIGAAHLSGRQH